MSSRAEGRRPRRAGIFIDADSCTTAISRSQDGKTKVRSQVGNCSEVKGDDGQARGVQGSVPRDDDIGADLIDVDHHAGLGRPGRQDRRGCQDQGRRPSRCVDCRMASSHKDASSRTRSEISTVSLGGAGGRVKGVTPRNGQNRTLRLLVIPTDG